MKRTRRGALVRPSFSTLAVVVLLAWGGPALAADVSKNVAAPSKNVIAARGQQAQQPRKVKRYVMTIASAIPVPEERYLGTPTTPSPVIIVQRAPGR